MLKTHIKGSLSLYLFPTPRTTQMGIPAYFSHLVKNFPQMIQHPTQIPPPDILYMDCNSIVYDVFHEIQNSEIPLNLHNPLETEERLIRETLIQMKSIIEIIQPTQQAILALDGVAPLAKMTQQRERRHRAFFQFPPSTHSPPKKENQWATHQITPGTRFMRNLTQQMRVFFQSNTKIIVSGSDEVGEGEHKCFQHLRHHILPRKEKKHTVFVYGLDADLIMLSLLHLSENISIYVFREPPSFQLPNLNHKTDKHPDRFLFLDIQCLAQEIIREMITSHDEEKFDGNRRVKDYVFLCFFLGN